MQALVVTPLAILCFCLLVAINTWHTRAVAGGLQGELARAREEVEAVRGQAAQCHQMAQDRSEELRGSQKSKEEQSRQQKKVVEEGRRLREAKQKAATKLAKSKEDGKVER